MVALNVRSWVRCLVRSMVGLWLGFKIVKHLYIGDFPRETVRSLKNREITATKQLVPMLGINCSHVGNYHYQPQAIQRVSTTDLPDPTDD